MFKEIVLLIWIVTATAAVELSHSLVGRDVTYYDVPRAMLNNDDEDIIKVLENEYERYEPPEIRRSIVRPSVEVGPGAFKSEIVQYPTNTLKRQLNYLMKLKKKIEERNKNLNA